MDKRSGIVPSLGLGLLLFLGENFSFADGLENVPSPVPPILAETGEISAGNASGQRGASSPLDVSPEDGGEADLPLAHLPPPPPPTPLELGMEALAQEKYRDALKHLTRASREGEAMAHFELGRMYALGQGTKPDQKKAYQLLRAAAEQEVVDAFLMVADCLREGRGIERNVEEAVQWYRALMAMGFPQAEEALQAIYSKDRRLALADPAAARLLAPLAEEGDIAAQRTLAFVLLDGPLPDKERGLGWLERAAAAGSADVRLELADVLQRLHPLERMAEAMDRIALQAERGNADAALRLALAYEKGRHLPPDRRKEFLWLQRAAAGGNAEALARLGTVYLYGEKGVQADAEWGWMLLDAAAKRGHAEAAQERDRLAKDMTTKQRKALQTRSEKTQSLWLPEP